jgi:hypothetical protein
MEPLALHLLKKVGGGEAMLDGEGDWWGGGGGGGGGGPDISYGDYWDSHVPDYEFQVNYDGAVVVSDSTRDAMSMLSSAAGWGAGAVVTGACIGVPAALSGPAALEVAALLSRPCTVLGTAAGVATGIWVGNRLAARIKILSD